MPTKNTVLAYLDRLPPNICRLIARDGRRALSNQDIAARSKLSLKVVLKLCRKRSWLGIAIEDTEAFRAACGVTPATERAQFAYLKRALKRRGPKAFRHLESLPPNTRQQIMRNVQPKV